MPTPDDGDRPRPGSLWEQFCGAEPIPAARDYSLLATGVVEAAAHLPAIATLDDPTGEERREWEALAWAAHLLVERMLEYGGQPQPVADAGQRVAFILRRLYPDGVPDPRTGKSLLEVFFPGAAARLLPPEGGEEWHNTGGLLVRDL